MNRGTPASCFRISGSCMSLRCCATYAFASGLRKVETGAVCAGISTLPSACTTTFGSWVAGRSWPELDEDSETLIQVKDKMRRRRWVNMNLLQDRVGSRQRHRPLLSGAL